MLNDRGQWVGVVKSSLSDQYRLDHGESIGQGTNFGVKATFIEALLDPRKNVKFLHSSRSEKLTLQEISERLSDSILRVLIY